MAEEYIQITSTKKMLKSEWDKLEGWEKLHLIAPKGLWNSFDFDNKEKQEKRNRKFVGE